MLNAQSSALASIAHIECRFIFSIQIPLVLWNRRARAVKMSFRLWMDKSWVFTFNGLPTTQTWVPLLSSHTCALLVTDSFNCCPCRRAALADL